MWAQLFVIDSLQNFDFKFYTGCQLDAISLWNFLKKFRYSALDVSLKTYYRAFSRNARDQCRAILLGRLRVFAGKPVAVLTVTVVPPPMGRYWHYMPEQAQIKTFWGSRTTLLNEVSVQKSIYIYCNKYVFICFFNYIYSLQTMWITMVFLLDEILKQSKNIRTLKNPHFIQTCAGVGLRRVSCWRERYLMHV